MQLTTFLSQELRTAINGFVTLPAARRELMELLDTPGAVVNAGTGNDSQSLEEARDDAYNSGRPLYLPSGLNIIQRKLLLYTGMKFFGDYYYSILQADDDYDIHDVDTDADLTCMVEVYHFSDNNPDEIIHHSTWMDGIRLIGLRGKTNEDLLYGWHGMFSTYNSKVTDCFFEDFGDGAPGAADPSGSYNNLIAGNYFRRCGRGVGLTGTDEQYGNKVLFNYFSDCETGISGNFPWNVLIQGNNMDGVNIGINFDGSYQSKGGIEILDNVINCTGANAIGIYFGTGDVTFGYCSKFVIDGNTISHSSTSGSSELIQMNTANNGRISNNQLNFGSTISGIGLRGTTSKILIEKNRLVGGNYGILLQSGTATDITIRRNIGDTATNTIYIDSGATGTLIQDNDFSAAAGTISDSGVNTINEVMQVTAAGTAYSLTNAAATLDFGTTDPVLTLPRAGKWRLEAFVQLDYSGATVVAETATVKLRRTNNSAADVSGATLTLDLPVSTTLTNTYGVFRLPDVYYTATAGDTIALQGLVSATLGAGTIKASAAGIVATPIF